MIAEVSITHFSGDWIYSVLLYMIYSSLLYALPDPKPDERVYGFVYRFLHALGMNLRRAGILKNGTPNVEEKK